MQNIYRPVQKNMSSDCNSQIVALNNIQRDIVSFSGRDFDVRKIKGLPCPYCGGKIYTPEEISRYGKKASVVVGSDIKKMMLGITFSTNPNYKVQNDIKILMIKESTKSRSQNMQDILYYAMPEAEKRLINVQKKILKRAEKLSCGLKGETTEEVYNDFKTIYSILEKKKKGDTENIIFKRKPLIDGFMNILRKEKIASNRQVLKEMVNILIELPNAQTNTDSFIVKYHRRSPREIMESLLSPCIATEEHIEPQNSLSSKKYKNDFNAKKIINRAGNKMSSHAKCNNKREHKPLETVIKESPEVKLFMAEHIIALRKYKPQKVYDEHLPIDYIDKIVKTISRESKFNLDAFISHISNKR